MQHIVGVADLAVSQNSADEIITYALGSCLGVTAYDPTQKIGGMVHCMLPLSSIDKSKAQSNPHMFVDTGLTDLLQKLFKMGAHKDTLVIKAAGCAKLLDEKNLFKIGSRNHTIFRKIMWKNNMLITAEDVAGSISRTLSIQLETGITTIKSGRDKYEL